MSQVPRWLKSLDIKKSKKIFKEEVKNEIDSLDENRDGKKLSVEETKRCTSNFPASKTLLRDVFEKRFSGRSFILQVLKCSSSSLKSSCARLAVSDGLESTDRCELTCGKDIRTNFLNQISQEQFPLVRVISWYIRRDILFIDSFEVLSVESKIIGYPEMVLISEKLDVPVPQTLKASSELKLPEHPKIFDFSPIKRVLARSKCKECGELKPPNCGMCEICLGKVEFGGDGRLRSACLNRVCSAGHQFQSKLGSEPGAKIKVKKVRRVKAPVEIRCDLCPAKFNSKTTFTNHKRRVHIKPNRCKNCDFKTGSTYELKHHMLFKHEGVTPTCEECGLTFASFITQKRHMVAVHGEKNLQCKECEFTTTTEKNLKKHFKHNHSGITFDCEKCPLKYVSKRGLERHIKINHEYFEMLKCQLCDFKTKEKASLKKHVESVHEGKRYHCDQCDFNVKCKSALKRHKLCIHENKYFSCDQCNYVSSRKCYLKIHQDVQHKGKRFKCTECPKETKSQESLRKHIQVQHANGGMFMCDQCDYKTPWRQSIKDHSIVHGGGVKLKCDLCSFESFRSYVMKSHKEFKHLGLGFVCGICGERKSRKAYLAQHMRAKHKNM